MRGFYQEDDNEEDDEVSALYNQLMHFSTSGQHERVISTGAELLAIDPEDTWVHMRMASAYTGLEKYNESEKHLKKAIATDPESADAFTEYAYLELQRGRMGAADDKIKVSIKLDPTNDYAWYIYGILCVNYDDFKQAQFCVKKIRELQPENDYASKLEVMAYSNIDGANQYSKEQKIEEYEKLLAADPEDEFANYNLGLIYLDELNNAQKAEYHFRKALELDPTDKDYQKGLIKAWRKRDLFLRILWIPFLPIAWSIKVVEWANKEKWPYIFMIFLFKYLIIVSIVVAVLFFVVFWPIAKLYEYFTLAEIHRKLGVLKLYSGVMEKIHKWEFRKRMMLFVSVVVLYWGSLAVLTPIYFLDPEANKSFLYLISGLFFLFILFSWGSLIFSIFRKGKRSIINKSFNSKV